MYIVAEVGASHNQSLEHAQALVDAAALAGADAVKFQLWSPDSMVGRDALIESGPWRGQSLTGLYARARMPWEWVPILAKQAQALGLDWFSSVFDVGALAYLESLGCPQYKIASFEITDIPLLREVAKTGKPIMISTGVATDEEIGAALSVTRDVTLLHCVSEYPAAEESYQMDRIWYLKTRFGTLVGLSDHTIGDMVPIMATAKGATVIERHITLDRKGGGLDDAFASTPEMFGYMVSRVRKAEEAMRVRQAKTPVLDLKRSAWLMKPMKKGEVLTLGHVMFARPNGSLSWQDLEKVLGCPAKQDIPEGWLKLDYFDF